MQGAIQQLPRKVMKPLRQRKQPIFRSREWWDDLHEATELAQTLGLAIKFGEMGRRLSASGWGWREPFTRNERRNDHDALCGRSASE